MRKAILLLSTALLTLGVACPAQETSVTLRNTTNFPVDVELFYDEQQDIPEILLEEVGTQLSFSIPAGGAESFSRSCEDLQAIFINDADMRIAPGISPESSTRVFREPDDFTCGDTLTFTFVQNALGTQLNINFSR